MIIVEQIAELRAHVKAWRRAGETIAFVGPAGAGKSTIEMLESVGAFGDIPKTAQLSLF